MPKKLSSLFAVGDRIKLRRPVTCSTYLEYEGTGYEELTEVGPPLSEGQCGTITKLFNDDEAFIDFDGSDDINNRGRVWVLFAEMRKLSILELLAEATDVREGG